MKTPTDTELNLAMCEWMGISWTTRDRHFKGQFQGESSQYTPCILKENTFIPLPDYLSDDSPRRLLNEAEKKLTYKQFLQFETRLINLCDAEEQLNGLAEYNSHPRWASATARQRVISILLVVKPELFDSIAAPCAYCGKSLDSRHSDKLCSPY